MIGDLTCSTSPSQSSREAWPARSGAGEDGSGGGGGEQYPTSCSPLQLTPTLRSSQIRRLADTALAIAKTLPDFEPRQQNSSKRKACKELEASGSGCVEGEGEEGKGKTSETSGNFRETEGKTSG